MYEIRRTVAGRFGRLEHTSGIILGVMLLTDCIIYKNWNFYSLFGVWLSYFISHRLEKLFYGQHGYR